MRTGVDAENDLRHVAPDTAPLETASSGLRSVAAKKSATKTATTLISLAFLAILLPVAVLSKFLPISYPYPYPSILLPTTFLISKENGNWQQYSQKA
jgi:hypothetical protein